MQNILNIIDLYESAQSSALSNKNNRHLYGKKYPFSFYQKNKENGLDLAFSLPGYGENDISCYVSNNTLKIELTEVPDHFLNYKGTYSFQLPEDTNADSLTATISNGVLRIAAENSKQKEKRIKINKQQREV